jgi:hypothetical protein
MVSAKIDIAFVLLESLLKGRLGIMLESVRSNSHYTQPLSRISTEFAVLKKEVDTARWQSRETVVFCESS